MSLKHEEIEEVKAQLREQVQHLPAQQREAALHQINNLSEEAIESLVERQKESSPQQEKNIFRMIIDGSVPAAKVEENDFAIAVLDINPVSKGHMMILQKTPVKEEKELSKSTMELAKLMAHQIQSKLKAKSVDIVAEIKFGEAILNLIPSYGAPINLSSPRKKSSVEELEQLARKLKPEKKIEVIKIKTKPSPSDEILKLRRRIP